MSERPPLIAPGAFTAASGVTLPWKIECDALQPADWAAIAAYAADRMPPFTEVRGVPRGGLKLERALDSYRRLGFGMLYVDDVWTTGGSMRREGLTDNDHGFVVFARGPLPSNVKALFYTEDAR